MTRDTGAVVETLANGKAYGYMVGPHTMTRNLEAATIWDTVEEAQQVADKRNERAEGTVYTFRVLPIVIVVDGKGKRTVSPAENGETKAVPRWVYAVVVREVAELLPEKRIGDVVAIRRHEDGVQWRLWLGDSPKLLQEAQLLDVIRRARDLKGGTIPVDPAHAAEIEAKWSLWYTQ